MAQSQLEAVTAFFGNVGQSYKARAIRRPCVVGVLYTDAHDGERAGALFESVMRQRLERLGAKHGVLSNCA